MGFLFEACREVKGKKKIFFLILHSVHCVQANAAQQNEMRRFFGNCFPPDGNLEMDILRQGNPVFPQQLLQQRRWVILHLYIYITGGSFSFSFYGPLQTRDPHLVKWLDI